MKIDICHGNHDRIVLWKGGSFIEVFTNV